MKKYPSQKVIQTGTRLFAACGAPQKEAELAAEELVEASLYGIDSHGAIRFIMYANHCLQGLIKVGAPVSIVRETPTTAVVDCGMNFGAVSATRMVEIACDKARESHVAVVTSKRSYHVGRLGTWTQKVAEKGFFAFAVVNSHKPGHFVVPFGGREGRLATNPLSWACPTQDAPIVMDMSTSMIAEGKIRSLMHEGKPTPPGCILDGEGFPTDDPKKFYGPPRGAILPFGGDLGYKGTGLGMLVEVLGACLAGHDVHEDAESYMNGMTLIVINPEGFGGHERFLKVVTVTRDYMASSAPAPGSKGVVIPGQLDFAIKKQRLQEGIPLSDESVTQIIEVGHKAGVDLTGDFQ